MCIGTHYTRNSKFRCLTKLLSFVVELEPEYLSETLMFGAKIYEKVSGKNLICKKRVLFKLQVQKRVPVRK